MAPTRSSGSIVLRDGRTVSIEPMRASDASRLDSFHHTLSRETTQLRFFAVHPELTERELDRFTHVDHRNREALVAVSQGEIVGVGRFDRTEVDGDEAEVAFVVADAWQNVGLGSALLARLAARAIELGVQRLVADTLVQNHRMLAIFRTCGLPRTENLDSGVIRVTLELGLGPSLPRIG